MRRYFSFSSRHLAVSSVVSMIFMLAVTSCASSGRGVYHEVRKGETLGSIAKAYDLDPDTLATWNDLRRSSKLNAGDRLFVPGAEKSLSTDKSEPSKKAADTTPPKKKNGERVASVEPPPKASKKAVKLKWPLENPKMLSGFGERSGRNHDGLDLGAPRGTKIRAAADGRVIYSDNGLRGYGNLVIIRHEGNWATVYAHNEKNLVEKDDFVRAGEVIGLVGDTGVATTTHLHFELRDGKSPIDPSPYLP